MAYFRLETTLEADYKLIFSGGMVHFRDGANTQYVTGTSLLMTAYSDLLARYNQKITCGGQQFDAHHLMTFAKAQV